MCLRELRFHVADCRLFVCASRAVLTGREVACVSATLREGVAGSAYTSWGGMHGEDVYAWYVVFPTSAAARECAATLRTTLARR